MIDFTLARKHMVDGQIRPSDITLYPVIKALLDTPREAFVPRDKKAIAYADQNIDLGNNRTLLAPRTIGRMLEGANIQPTDMVLCIGANLGYVPAVISRLSQVVICVESDESFASVAEQTLSEQGQDNCVVHVGDLAMGEGDHAPYDVVLINGAIEILPDILMSQVKDHGKIIAIRKHDGRSQISVGIKSGDRIAWDDQHNAFAPVLPGFEVVPTFVF